MDSAKLNDWLQVIGVFGVMASLVFVGLQLRQTQEIALAGQYNARTAASQDLYLAALETRHDLRTGYKPIAEQTPSEIAANYAYGHWIWVTLENHHFQYESGFLSEESWQAFTSIMLSSRSLESAMQAFETRKGWMRPSFVRFVEQLWREAGEPTTGGN